MRQLRGPRPWSIRLFAILFLGAALVRLADGLAHPTPMLADLFRWLPGAVITHDMAIVALSAQFSIACIPVALIWFRASRIARILVGVMIGIRLTALPEMLVNWHTVDMIQPAMLSLSAMALALLFTPSANRWLAMKGRRAADAFT